MTTLPNPFTESALVAAMPADVAAAPDLSDPPVAAAENFENRFVLDVEAFMNDIEPLPAFLCRPSQAYLRPTDIMPVLKVLSAY